MSEGEKERERERERDTFNNCEVMMELLDDITRSGQSGRSLESSHILLVISRDVARHTDELRDCKVQPADRSILSESRSTTMSSPECVNT